MPTARLVGYWKSALRDAYALPQHFESVLEADVRARLVAYLDAGALVNKYRGVSHCRYGCGGNGSAERTDGEWVWPTGLSHYVAVHGVALPGEFLDHVASQGSSGRADSFAGSHISADDTDWLRWSDERMPIAYKAALERAIAAADVCATNRLTAAARDREAQLGVSDAPCMRSGCDNRACHNRALCGRCLAEGDGTAESIRHQCDGEQLAGMLDELMRAVTAIETIRRRQ